MAREVATTAQIVDTMADTRPAMTIGGRTGLLARTILGAGHAVFRCPVIHPRHFCLRVRRKSDSYARHDAIILPTSSREAPSTVSDLIIRSTETAGSPDSTFATLDWLEPIIAANST